MKLNNSFMHVCVTGGAGYIGSHVVLNLLENTNHSISIIDNLSTGSLNTINTLNEIANENQKLLKVNLVDITDTNKLDNIFKVSNFDVVFHLAAFSQVKESNENQYKYKHNNIKSTRNLLESMKKHNVNYLVFSSSAAVYESKNKKLTEDSTLNPSSVYGQTKLECENIIKKFEKTIKYINLRFFNAVGCDYQYRIGEMHNPETHLFPIIAKSILSNKLFNINGDTFDTDDGTCIRDYIHVEDLAVYHIASMSYLLEGNKSQTINCGYSKGYSVKEIVRVMKKVSKKELDIRIVSKREGDSASLVADTSKLDSTIGKYHIPIYKDNIELTCKQAYEWEILKMKYNKRTLA